jgi:hypothetical protein
MARPIEMMRKAEVKKLRRWRKVGSVGFATIHKKLSHGKCSASGCCKPASYCTPHGKRCFGHAAQIVKQWQEANNG